MKTLFVARGAVAVLGAATPAVAGLAHNTTLNKHIGVGGRTSATLWVREHLAEER